LAKHEIEDSKEEQHVKCITIEEEYKLWLTRNHEKRVLACTTGWQRVKYNTDEEDILWKERRAGRTIGGSKDKLEENKYTEWKAQMNERERIHIQHLCIEPAREVLTEIEDRERELDGSW
jgi:hypothetical protein